MICDRLSAEKITSRKNSRTRSPFEEAHHPIRDKRKRSLQRGIREMRGNPGKYVLETKETKKTFKRLVVTCITWPQQRSACTRPKKRSALLVEGGTGDLCQLLAVSENCQTSDHDSTLVVSLAHSVTSFQ